MVNDRSVPSLTRPQDAEWDDTVPSRSQGQQQILDAALEVFARYGYEGASVRQVAAAAGVSAANIYHHYRGKQDLLAGITQDVLARLVAQVERALELVADDEPHVRLKVAIRAFVGFYLANQTACGVLDSERRYLEPARAESHIAGRRRLQRVFDAIIDAGIEAGSFHPRNRYLSSRAIMVICRDVAHWWRPNGDLDASQVANEHAALALDLLGYRGPSIAP